MRNKSTLRTVSLLGGLPWYDSSAALFWICSTVTRPSFVDATDSHTQSLGVAIAYLTYIWYIRRVLLVVYPGNSNPVNTRWKAIEDLNNIFRSTPKIRKAISTNIWNMKCHAILSIEDQQDIASIKMLDHNHSLVFDLLSKQGTERIQDPSRKEAQIWLYMRLVDILHTNNEYIFRVYEDQFGYLPDGIISDRSNVIREEPAQNLL